MDNKTLSLKQIAELAGTSTATVSRVINQNGRFSKETEKRVKDIIEKYDYQPNQIARSLRVSHTRVIGLLVPDIKNEFFASITKAVQKNLLLKNYMTLICSTNENVMEAKEQIQMLLGYKVSGIMYIGGDDIIELMDIPTVYIDRDPRDMNIELDKQYVMIECDNIQGGYLAGHELVEKGARHIAVVCYNRQLSTIKKRIKGLRLALDEQSVGLNMEYILEAQEVSVAEGIRIAGQIMNRVPDVDGIFFTSDLLAVGAVNYFKKCRIKIPDQIKIVGFDDISAGIISTPKLTTIRQPVEELGYCASQCILEMIQKREIVQHRKRIPVKLIVRETT